MSKGTIIYNGFFELPDKGASANRVVSNGKIFTALGYNVIFLGSDYSDDRFGGIAQIANHPDMYCEHHPSSTVQWFKRITSVDNLASVMDMYPDTVAVILYNSPTVYTKNVYRYLKGSGIKLYYDCTEWSKDTEGSFIKRAYKSSDESGIEKIHSYTDGMIVIGSIMQKHYSKYVPTLVLPPLVDTEDKIWHQKPFEHDYFEFCFAGFPGGNKESVDILAEAFLSLKDDCRLRIIGMDKRDFLFFYPYMEDKINDKILFMGPRSHEKTINYILGCDCYVFVRQSDKRNNAGFPTKFTEAITSGKPVICSSVSDIASYIKEGENGYIINPLSSADIAKKMQEVINAEKTENKLNNTFDYRNYIKQTGHWLKKTGLSNE